MCWIFKTYNDHQLLCDIPERNKLSSKENCNLIVPFYQVPTASYKILWTFKKGDASKEALETHPINFHTDS